MKCLVVSQLQQSLNLVSFLTYLPIHFAHHSFPIILKQIPDVLSFHLRMLQYASNQDRILT